MLPILQQIATQAADKDRVFTNLAHLIDVPLLCEAFYMTRKDGAVGVDEISGAQYAENLEENLKDLHERLRTRKYRASRTKRVYVPKEGSDKGRPIGITTFEDKIVQRAVVMLMESVYENDFFESSCGFRPGRGAHTALSQVRERSMEMGVQWIVEVDIKGFFDNLDHDMLREMIHRRIKDGGLDRLIGKWLKAGIQDGNALSYPTKGTPQGGVISPMLANIYLHYVLDEWFVQEVQPRMKGKTFLTRYADDFIIGCEYEEDARRILRVLPKRLKKFGLTVHPDKTKLIQFKRARKGHDQDKGNGTFDFLGFVHYWGKSMKGYWVIKRRTMAKRMRRVLKAINEWCRRNRHLSLRLQYKALSAKLKGLYQYYGINGNFKSIAQIQWRTVHCWLKWLRRRTNKPGLPWVKFNKILRLYPLPKARIAHSNV